VNEAYLRGLGVGTILGGEFEEGLANLAERLQEGAGNHNSGATQLEPVISLGRQKFLVPDRAGMPELAKYARVVMPGGEQRNCWLDRGDARLASIFAGTARLCRCTTARFAWSNAKSFLQISSSRLLAGARHITFGDPDFFNGPAHALSIVEAMHREFPELSYDVTIKNRTPAEA